MKIGEITTHKHITISTILVDPTVGTLPDGSNIDITHVSHIIPYLKDVMCVIDKR